MAELKEILENIGKSFEEYKRTNDARFEELKNGTGNAGEYEAKLAKIEEDLQKKEKQLSDLEAKMNRPGFAGASFEDQLKADHKKAFNAFVRNAGAIRRYLAQRDSENAAGGRTDMVLFHPVR